MAQAQVKGSSISDIDIPLERDMFLRNVVRELSGLLQDVVGLEEASGFISVVGQNIGHQINDTYKRALKVSSLSHAQIGQVLQDLKSRIQGDFYIVEANENKIVFGNRTCPFGDKVKDRPSLCMMTSNVFGTISAENAGYAKIELQKTIAQGDPECCVVVYLEEDDEAALSPGREYYQASV